MIRVVTTFFVSLVLSATAFADHPPKRMLKNMDAYSNLGMTGMLGPFTVNVAKFGTFPSGKTTEVGNKNFDKFLADKYNMAAIVMKKGEIIYERYNKKHKLDSNSPLVGMSMSKTAASAAIGHLLCNGKITSLEDTASKYSKSLASTPYADVTIRNILQMNSGVSPLGRSDEKQFNRKSRGMQQFDGQANVREALAFYDKAARAQGTKMNYHSTDTLALSVLVEEIAGSPLSHVFYNQLYQKFGQSGYMHWTSDKSGTTVAFSDLVMTARDWVNFGVFIMREKKAKTCFGNFFTEGVENAVGTGKTNGSKYGYQSWVFPVNGRPTLTLQGHGGQFMVLDEKNDTILLIISINERYKAGNLFKNIAKFAEKLNKSGNWN